jgi:hypothetical protein
MSTVRAPGPLTRLARRHGLVRSPLRRSTDRIEAAATVTVTVLAVLVALLATITAMRTYHRDLIHAAATTARETSVTAVLLTNAELQYGTSAEQGLTTGTSALARWALPHGQQRVAPLWVGADRHAGDRVTIWIDQHGNRADPPQTPGFVIANAAVPGVDVVVGGWVALGALWWIVCRVLSRINATRWDMQWARIEPGWSRRTWQ